MAEIGNQHDVRRRRPFTDRSADFFTNRRRQFPFVKVVDLDQFIERIAVQYAALDDSRDTLHGEEMRRYFLV